MEALSVKSGPTESGEVAPPPPVLPSSPVGGEMIPVDKLSIFLSHYWLLLILLFLAPFAFILYKKRGLALRLLTPIVFRFVR